jgi:hypothetical protein
MKKLQPPARKLKGINNSTKQTTQHYKGLFPNIQKILICFALLPVDFEGDICIAL